MKFLTQIIYPRDLYFTNAYTFTILDVRFDHQITKSLLQYSIINSHLELQYASNYDRTEEPTGIA